MYLNVIHITEAKVSSYIKKACLSPQLFVHVLFSTLSHS